MKLLSTSDWVDWLPLLGPVWFFCTLQWKRWPNGAVRHPPWWYTPLNGVYFGLTLTVFILKYFAK